MTGLTRLVAALLFVATSVASAQQCPPLPGRHIRVADGTSIHIREWGGKGPWLVFLSGFAQTAFVFEDFAPLLTDRFRVIGITKRGVPPSDTSSTDYSMESLNSDIVTVMDSLKIRQAHIAGWSFGGEEAIRLAVTHPDRVLSVALLDSYDNSKQTAMFKELDGLKSPPIRETAEDSASLLARLWLTRRLGFRPLPVANFCAVSRFGSNGKYLGDAVSPRVRTALRSAIGPVEYARVHTPVLALFKQLRAVQDMYPDYAIMSREDRALADAEFPPTAKAYEASFARVRSQLPGATVVIVPGAAHNLFVSDPEIVLREMLRFYDRIGASGH